MKTVRAFLFSVMCLAPALPLLGDVPDWENEEVTGINKEAPRASVFPASDKTLSLNGDWKFKFSMTPDERPADFFNPPIPFPDGIRSRFLPTGSFTVMERPFTRMFPIHSSRILPR